MRFLKKKRRKKVISVVLATLMLFMSVLTNTSNSYAQRDYRPQTSHRLEYKTNNKSIGIKNSSIIRIDGKIYKARKMKMTCTAYTDDPITYMGTPTHWGVIAVDPNVIPLGTKVYIPQFNMIFSCEDVGGAIKGSRIDIFMDSYYSCMQFGMQDLDVYVLD